jgi:hypothetical protein
MLSGSSEALSIVREAGDKIREDKTSENLEYERGACQRLSQIFMNGLTKSDHKIVQVTAYQISRLQRI